MIIDSRLLDAQDDLRHVQNLLELIIMATNSLDSGPGNAIAEACEVAKGSIYVAESRLSEMKNAERD